MCRAASRPLHRPLRQRSRVRLSTISLDDAWTTYIVEDEVSRAGQGDLLHLVVELARGELLAVDGVEDLDLLLVFARTWPPVLLSIFSILPSLRSPPKGRSAVRHGQHTLHDITLLVKHGVVGKRDPRDAGRVRAKFAAGHFCKLHPRAASGR